MNKLGIHALVFAGDTSRTSVDRIIGSTRAAGYDIVEFSLHDSLSLDIARTRSLLIDNSLDVVCSRGLAFDADVSSNDPATVAKGAQLLHESLRITHELGGTLLTGALYSALGKYGAPLTDRGRANVVSVLKDLAQEADHLSMTLGLEVCNRYETNVVNTAADALRLADDIGADNVAVHLDIYHMNIEEADFTSPVHTVGDRLGYVHIGENHRGYLGSGHLDFTSFFHALHDIDYTGPITFESFSSTVIAQGLSNDLAIWRNLWTDGPDLAAHARAFIASQIHATHAA